MAPRASKLCTYPGCANLSGRESRCPDHARAAWDRPRTESSRRTGTRRFKTIRTRVLARDGGVCRVRLHSTKERLLRPLRGYSCPLRRG